LRDPRLFVERPTAGAAKALAEVMVKADMMCACGRNNAGAETRDGKNNA
jgi:hypothetical protein